MSQKRGRHTTEFQIDAARPGDETDIAALIRALSVYEKLEDQCVATPETVKAQLFGERPVAEALVVRTEGKVVAFALYFLSFSTFLCKPGLYLEDLFVLPDFRQRGIGGLLLRRLAKICIERGYGRMEWACLDWNELAKAQYRKAGAAPLEDWRTWRLTGKALQEFAAGYEEPEQPKKPSSPAKSLGSRVVIYTDGGCRPNPGVGGWAAILISGEREREISGGEPETTNNRMEMLAAINALEALKKPCEVEFHTDSQYLRQGITSWIIKWKKAGWKRGREGASVKNVDLWKRLDAAIQRHQINWVWVRGHTGNVYNERCDELATRAIDRIEEESSGK